MKKRIFTVILAGLLALSACGKGEEETSKAPKNPAESAEVGTSAESVEVSAPVENVEVSTSVESEEVSTPAESEEVSTPVENDGKTEESSAPYPSSEEESEPVESTPVESEPVSSAPIESEPVESEPVESAPPTSQLPKKQICAQIAAMKDGGFVTNIENPAAAEKLEELESYLAGKGYGFFYCDLEFGGYISCETNKVFSTASTSKLPYIKHLATRVDKGEIDTAEKLQQLESYYDPGSGILKNNSPGGWYSVDTLMDYVLRYSDNIAYKMLIKRFGLSEFTAYLETLGVDFSTYNGYGNCTAAEMAAMLYDVAMYDGNSKELILNAGCNASYNYQFGAELKEYRVLQKYGVIKPNNLMYHDIAVVYAPHPYIIVMYTNINYDSGDKNIPFRTVGRLVEEINGILYS